MLADLWAALASLLTEAGMMISGRYSRGPFMSRLKNDGNSYLDFDAVKSRWCCAQVSRTPGKASGNEPVCKNLCADSAEALVTLCLSFANRIQAILILCRDRAEAALLNP